MSRTDNVPNPSSAALAVSYLRVSTKEQAERDGDPEGYSIPAQREANRRKAETLGAVVVDEFVDRGESARSADRPELKRLLAYVSEHPEVSYVIVHKVDRLARNRTDDVEINLALTRAGVTLVSATENIDETPSGMLLHGIMSSIAEFYSRNLATEVLKGMNQKVKTGGTPGKAPLGYRNTRGVSAEGREVRTVELDTERAELIRWAFQAYATGDWTLVGLTAELELRGLTNTPTPKFPIRPVRPSHLYAMLTHPYYKGEVVWKGARHPGRHPQLVDHTTWAQVQSVLAAHGPGEKHRDHQHYLKSSVFCGDCGSRLVITHAKNRYGAVYPYFICLGRHQKRTDCTRKALLVPVVETLIEEFYGRVQLRPALRQRVEAILRGELADQEQQSEAQRRDLTTQQQRLRREREKLLQAHYAGAVPLDLMKVEQDRISSQLEQVDGRLEAATAQLATIQANLSTALDFLQDCGRAYREAAPSVRRLLNQSLFEQLYVEVDGVSCKLAEPFRTLLGPEMINIVSRDGWELELAENTSSECDGRENDRGSDWMHEWVRLIRSASITPDGSDVEEQKMDQHLQGLKAKVVVRPAGFEPATS